MRLFNWTTWKPENVLIGIFIFLVRQKLNSTDINPFHSDRLYIHVLILTISIELSILHIKGLPIKISIK